MTSLTPPLQFLLLTFAGWVNRHQQDAIDYLIEENRVLREHLPRGRRLLLTDDQRRRLAVKGKLLGRKILSEIAGTVTPDTILRWHRNLIARKYDGSRARRPGRPRTKQDIEGVVTRMATENPTWGYTRLRDALKHLGHEICRNTVKRILGEQGITPVPERGNKTPWQTFLAPHWEGLAAADFFTAEVLTPFGLVRYWVFFVIELETRRVEIAGITSQPCGTWMERIGRHLTGWDGFLQEKTHLILDRDPLYTAAFRRLLKDSRVRVVRRPASSPNLNAHCERFIGSFRRECLNKLVILGERHLRHVVREFAAHDHLERHHQGLDGALVMPEVDEPAGTGAIECRERLGGMLKFYSRAAA